MKAKIRQEVVLLRVNERLSYATLRQRFNVSKSTLSRWLKEFPLTENEILELRRKSWSKGEAAREKFRATMRLKREEKKLRIYNEQQKYFVDLTRRERFIAGLMLYFAEGTKSTDYGIIMTNTDPKMLRFFIRWLDEFFAVRSIEMKAQLHLYENMDIVAEQKYWQRELGFKDNQFYKVQIRRVRENTYTYRGSLRHGTCQVMFHSGEKKMLLTQAIHAFIDSCY